jgi:predicted enzyme related to lactoylglutathione lyase
MATSIQVTFDCADPDRLATFWATALGYRKQDPPDGYASWPVYLAAQGIPEDQWHAASARVDAEVDRLRGAGATHLRPVEEHGEYWVVMADPEGNEFCLQ